MVFKVLDIISAFCIGRKASYLEYIIFAVFIVIVLYLSDLAEKEKEELKEDALHCHLIIT